MSTDYGAFRARGGRLILYAGLADPVVSPFDTIGYYESVAKAMGGMTATQSFFRFFPAPGMAHCGGGAGPNTFDALGALDAWVERGTALDSIVASHSTGGTVDRTRPLCPYPAVARYGGTGSIDDAANFTCTPRDDLRKEAGRVADEPPAGPYRRTPPGFVSVSLFDGPQGLPTRRP